MRCATNLVGLLYLVEMKLTLPAGSMRSASVHPTVPSVAWPTNPVLAPKRQDKSIAQSEKGRVPRSSAKHDTFRQNLDDDYGYDDIDDTEILRAVQRGELESFTDVDDIIGNASMTLGTQCNKEVDRSPERLPNGKYSCHHHCKDKSRCKHLCCREGINKQRKKVKTRTDQDFDYPQDGAHIVPRSRQLPLIFPALNSVVDLTQRERDYRPAEWSFPDNEAAYESRASGKTGDRYGSQRSRLYREPQTSTDHSPFKIPAFKEPTRANGLLVLQSRRSRDLTCLSRIDRLQWTA
jgi:hypothetical protein